MVAKCAISSTMTFSGEGVTGKINEQYQYEPPENFEDAVLLITHGHRID